MLQQGGYAAVPPSTIGSGGYTFAFSDGVAGGSTACISTLSFCGKGSIGVANPPGYTIYGGGIGVNLNQMMNATAKGTFAATGTGVSYALSNLPTSGPVRMIIDNAGVDYCSTITAATGLVTWNTFFAQCYNLPGGDAGASLGSAPATATHVQFQIASTATAGSFDFCVTSLKFM